MDVLPLNRPATAIGVHHEWGRLREVVVGLGPRDDFVIFYEDSMRWVTPPFDEVYRRHAGKRLIEVDAALAERIERQVDALADLLSREGIVVHRPQRLHGRSRTFLAPNGEGAQIFPRDGMIVIGSHLIEASLKIQCRQRERFGLRPIIETAVRTGGARWSSVPFGSPDTTEGPFLEGGDVLLNGREIYVGISGCASDQKGADWLQALLGPDYRVIPIELQPNVLHLDCALALVRPGLAICCPEKLPKGLPPTLREWEVIAVTPEEASRLATNVLVLDEGRIVVDADNVRITDELRKRRLEVLTIPFDGPITTGGGLRCAHHPLVRESFLS